MTMNKNMLGLVFGAVLLAGCADEVMQQRKYVPADDSSDKSTVSEVAPENTDTQEKRQVAVEERNVDDTVKPQSTADENKPTPRQTSEFKPMTEKFDDSGVSSDESEVAAPGEYIVRPGDTLGKIAVKHHVRLTALMKANNLTEKNAKRLRVGQKLVIPGGAAAKNTSRTAKPNKARGVSAAKAGKTDNGGKASIQPGEYIVKAGDTPERIARRAKVRLSELMAANKLTEDDARRLRVGQKLVIPGQGVKSAVPTPKQAEKKPGKVKTATAESKPANAAATTQTETTKEEAAILNEMQDTQPGQNPAGQSVDAGTTAPAAGAPAAADAKETPWVDVTEDIPLAEFAKKYNTTPEALRAANPDGIGDVIKKGDTIFLPR